jgi:hypothetical protein
MQNHLVVAMLASLSLFACAGSNQEAKSEADVWAGFKGTYSQSADGSTGERSTRSEGARKDAKAKTARDGAKVEEKKTSKGTVNGESLSTVSVESLTDASKAALKSKLVSNSVVTGARYESVQVQLKGVTVNIIRPAATPAPNGPAVPSPKTKIEALGKSDASWYDDEADVLVFVHGGKKGSAQRALSALVVR